MIEAAAALAAAHFAAPLAYYLYARRWLRRPWGVEPREGHTPTITIIIPTYNEAPLIEAKLDDIARQDYPPDKLQIIVVDSASTDGTPEKAERWARQRQAPLEVLREPQRNGKAHALNLALKHARGDIVVITDADSHWPDPQTLRKAARWLADPSVGAVTCLKRPAGGGGVEAAYRDYYNVLRLAESKKWATPIFHGELAAFRKELLEKIGGFPTHLGADDSHTAVLIAAFGYRAIAPEDLHCVELVPRQYWRWRIRRAQHLIQNFAASLRLKTPSRFRPVLYAEAYLHLVNPWLLPAALATALAAGPPGWALAALGLALLAHKPYRTWIAMQMYLMIAALRNLWTKEIMWKKEDKIILRSKQRHNFLLSFTLTQKNSVHVNPV
ncbi:glycosyltransferase [Pyrobaculum ferrireducens]|uniref:Glycosyl transferase, family 2 n=1 Tax=Pyrobaculum ferrireducens TaxID=1104324 RepID=G7VIE1_9CREN|nr:glycosyltransferase [Pyrobaculum ferrireducens]AET33421.1 glycosyl transferase, family 2 [Pyrobaculum ferrireducens]